MAARVVTLAFEGEFSTQALDSLRQPLETGEVVVARPNVHVRYRPACSSWRRWTPAAADSAGPAEGPAGAPRCQTGYRAASPAP